MQTVIFDMDLLIIVKRLSKLMKYKKFSLKTYNKKVQSSNSKRRRRNHTKKVTKIAKLPKLRISH